MSNFIIFFLTFYLLLMSVIGYGILFQKISFGAIKNLKENNSIYTGFYGIFFLTIISLITSLFLPHNFIHNSLLHLIGIILFIFLKVRNKIEYLKIIISISVFVIIALLISKTHDDFSYYHFTFTKYLTEQSYIWNGKYVMDISYYHHYFFLTPHYIYHILNTILFTSHYCLF